jgi:hypothetical protein
MRLCPVKPGIPVVREQFSEDHLLAAIRRDANRLAAAIRDAVPDLARAFVDLGPPRDDPALVAARIRKQEPAIRPKRHRRFACLPAPELPAHDRRGDAK